MTKSAILEFIIFFHCLSMLNDGFLKKTVKLTQDYRDATLIGFCVQLLLTDWKQQFSKSPFIDVLETMASYVLFEKGICRFKRAFNAFLGSVIVIGAEVNPRCWLCAQRRERLGQSCIPWLSKHRWCAVLIAVSFVWPPLCTHFKLLSMFALQEIVCMDAVHSGAMSAFASDSKSLRLRDGGV